MSANKCARCDQTVYPVEGLRCLDKIWHKGCFKCHECNMTLSLKNYKGFEKKPYCNAHCPQAKATTVADTPEIRRLAENTRIQSQAKYHEDFEKSKGKGFTAIADDPETLRLKNTSKIISNVAYHGELERKKQMEERRTSNEQDSYSPAMNNNNSTSINNNNNNNNNNSIKNQIRSGLSQNQEMDQCMHHNQANVNYHHQQQQQQQLQKQQQHQHQQLMKQHQMQQQQKQQQHQQQLQHQQQMLYAQDHNGQSLANRQQSQHIDGSIQQQQQYITQQYPIGHPQQQIIMRQQQQQQIMLQQQQQRHSLELNMVPLSRQAPKQSIANNQIPVQMVKRQIDPSQHQQLQQQQLSMKYMPINEAVVHQTSPMHQMIGGQPPSHLINVQQMGGVLTNQRMPPNAAQLINGPQMMQGYNRQQVVGHTNGVVSKQQQQFVCVQPPRNMIHPSQLHPMNQQQQQMRIPQSHQMQQQPTVPRRVFRAMYDYMANDVDEVSFFENDILIDCVNVDGNWLTGKVVRSGQTGMLPANYVTEFTG